MGKTRAVTPKKTSTTTKKSPLNVVEDREPTRAEAAALSAGVTRLIKDSFDDMSEKELYTLLKGDPPKPLIFHLKKHKWAAMLRQGRVPTPIINNLRNTYKIKVNPNAMAVAAEDEALSPEFRLALAACLCSNPAERDRKGLYGLLNVRGTNINKREVATLCGTMQNLNVVSSKANCHHVFQITKYFNEHTIWEIYPNLLAAVKDKLDENLAALAGLEITKKNNNVAWWSDHKDACAYNYNVQQVDQAFQDLKEKKNCAEQIAEITKGKLGMVLFKSALADQTRIQFVATISKFIDDLQKKPFNAQAFNSSKANALDQAKGVLAKSGAETIRYDCNFTPRDTEFELKKVSLFEHVDKTYYCYLVQQALGYKNGVPLLCVEDWVMPLGEDRSEIACPVSSAFIAEAVKGRNFFNKIVEERQAYDAHKIEAILDNENDRFLKMDKNWDLNKAFILSLAGEPGVRKIQADLAAMLPTAVKHVTLVQVLSSYDAYKKKPIWNYVPEIDLGPTRAAMGQLVTLQEGLFTASDFSSASGFSAVVAHRLEFFCKCTWQPDKKKIETKTLFGKAAAKKIIDNVIAAATGECDPESVEVAVQFMYLVDADKQSKVRDVAAQMVTNRVATNMNKKARTKADSEKKRTEMENALSLIDNMWGDA